MKLAYVKWKDAVYSDSDGASHQASTVELEEVGWLLDENKDAILLGLELQPEGYTKGRGRISVPRPGIVELRVVEFKTAFPKRSIVWQA